MRVVSCKKQIDEGLHTFLDMVGHWMKDSHEKHFEFVHRIVSSKEEFRSMQNLKRWVSKIKSICLIATFLACL